VLECSFSSAVDLTTVSEPSRYLAKRIAGSSAWEVGPEHQPQTFGCVLPDLSALPWHNGCQTFFELVWQPPCLYLRKPAKDTPISIGGVPVRQSTYVLLSRAEIELCAEEGGAPVLAFRLFRCSEQVHDADPIAMARGREPQRVTKPRSCRRVDLLPSP